MTPTKKEEMEELCSFSLRSAGTDMDGFHTLAVNQNRPDGCPARSCRLDAVPGVGNKSLPFDEGTMRVEKNAEGICSNPYRPEKCKCSDLYALFHLGTMFKTMISRQNVNVKA